MKGNLKAKIWFFSIYFHTILLVFIYWLGMITFYHCRIHFLHHHRSISRSAICIANTRLLIFFNNTLLLLLQLQLLLLLHFNISSFFSIFIPIYLVQPTRPCALHFSWSEQMNRINTPQTTNLQGPLYNSSVKYNLYNSIRILFLVDLFSSFSFSSLLWFYPTQVSFNLYLTQKKN